MIEVKLNRLLEAQRLSQRELARRTGSHPEVISRFARQATNGVSYELLERICAELDCRPGDLLDIVPEPITQIHLFDEPKEMAMGDSEISESDMKDNNSENEHISPLNSPGRS